MVEAFASEVTSERFCEALRFAFREVCLLWHFYLIIACQSTTAQHYRFSVYLLCCEGGG